ncbi:MAG: hypothetical protein KF900_06865 [Bacteroidetes bacterium]|nr:hypothetical protein [Bacteroidota bacterium]
MRTLGKTLSQAQLELLKISADLTDNDVKDLKKILADFFMKRAIKGADDVWKEKGWTDEDMDKILNNETL